MPILRKDVQYMFYATRSGLPTTQRNINDHMRAYYISQVGSSSANKNYLWDLEKQWLRKVITTNGGTPNSQYLSALWAQAVGAKGLRVGKVINDNQMTYWANVTSANGL